jgi:hypothetical protein
MLSLQLQATLSQARHALRSPVVDVAFASTPPPRVAFYLWGRAFAAPSLSVSRISSVADSLLVCRHCRTSCPVKVTPAPFPARSLIGFFSHLFLICCRVLHGAAAGSWFWVALPMAVVG